MREKRITKKPHKSLTYKAFDFLKAVRTGLEPATSCVTGRHSNQLNYRTNFHIINAPLAKRVQM